MYPQYVHSGHLVYVSKGLLLAAPFDLSRREVRGSPTAIVDEVASNPVYGFAQVSIAKSGTLLYRKGRTEGVRTIDWLDSDRNSEPLVADPALYQFPRFSPDGKRLAVVVIEGSSSVIWIYDSERGAKTMLSAGTGVNTSPVWTPNGRYLVFQSTGGMFWTRVDGTGGRAILTRSEVLQFPSSFSPDGKYLVFAEANPGPGAHLRTIRVEENSGHIRAEHPELLVELPSLNAFARFSPDGNWIAYASAESGTYEVYVRRFPDNGSQTQISVNGGTMPVWNPTKRELYYRTEDERIIAVAYTTKGNVFVPEKPREWSPSRLVNLGLTPNFDLHPGGARFAVLMPVGRMKTGESRRHEVLVLHFNEELRRRVRPSNRY
jgi:serine/threonine-protein kinase